MSNTFTPREFDLIEVIKVFPYETKQIVYAKELGVTPGRVSYMIKKLRTEYTPEEFLNFV